MTCEVCDEREATHTAEQHPQYDGWAATYGMTWPATCDECWRDADNYEPPEPDGECFRGGEAAAFLAEQQAEAMRVKRS